MIISRFIDYSRFFFYLVESFQFFLVVLNRKILRISNFLPAANLVFQSSLVKSCSIHWQSWSAPNGKDAQWKRSGTIVRAMLEFVDSRRCHKLKQNITKKFLSTIFNKLKLDCLLYTAVNELWMLSYLGMRRLHCNFSRRSRSWSATIWRHSPRIQRISNDVRIWTTTDDSWQSESSCQIKRISWNQIPMFHKNSLIEQNNALIKVEIRHYHFCLTGEIKHLKTQKCHF